jgi:hypothetical protein
MSTSSIQESETPQPRFLPIPTHGYEVKEWATTLHYAISEILLLAFEHRDLDLEEQQTYALNVCVRTLSDLTEIIADPEGLEDTKARKHLQSLIEKHREANKS